MAVQAMCQNSSLRGRKRRAGKRHGLLLFAGCCVQAGETHAQACFHTQAPVLFRGVAATVPADSELVGVVCFAEETRMDAYMHACSA